MPDGADGWPVYRGNAFGNAYSPLDEIHRGNVHRLQVAWTYRSGDAKEGNGSQIQTNPLLANGKLYVVTPRFRLLALHPGTGELIWSFEPEDGDKMRGVAYWEDGEDRRILHLARNHLYAIDADDGTPIRGFGDDGRVDTRGGLGRDSASISITHTSPGVVFGDLIIIGSRVGEGYGASPGHIRAYDVRSGEPRWIFHTIPLPGEFGFETWPEAAHREVGGANAWAGLSLDPSRGTVFASTGSAAFDFYGADRLGENLFANSIVALDARTGKRRWHYQTVHHDVWDYDLPSAPNLVTVTHGGKRIDAVAQVTKTGFVFVLDRATGRPLFPVEERPTPRSDVTGEQVWPTQPFPLKPAPFARQGMSEADLTNVSPEAQAFMLEKFRKHRGGPLFTPPSLVGTVFSPGTLGGAEWGGGAFDVETGILYVPANELPSISTLVPPATATPGGSRTEAGKALFLTNGCSGCHGLDRKGRDAFPALAGIGARSSRAEVERVIRRGRGGMPAYPNLASSEMESLLAFLLDEGDAPAAGADADHAALDGKDATPRYGHTGLEKLRDEQGRPGVKPPWGTLTAIDLNTGDFVWRTPLGEHPGAPREIQPTGTFNLGGGIVTKGGLLFIAATMDEKFRAIDKATGRVLWEHRLPAGGYALPATYRFGGKQYVVIAAGGGGSPGTPSGDAYVAFALP